MDTGPMLGKGRKKWTQGKCYAKEGKNGHKANVRQRKEKWTQNIAGQKIHIKKIKTDPSVAV